MAQWLRAHTVLAEDLSPVPSTRLRQLTTTVTPAPADQGIWPSAAPAFTQSDRNIHIQQQQQNQHT